MEKEIEDTLKYGAMGCGLGIGIWIVGNLIPSTGIENASLFVKVMAFPVGGFIAGMIVSTFDNEEVIKENSKVDEK